MFCHRCGTELPDDALFCVKCGHAVPAAGASTPAPAEGAAIPATAAAPALAPSPPMPAPARPKRRIALYFLVPLLLLVIVWALYRLNTPDKGNENLLQRMATQQYTMTLPKTTLSIPALNLNATKFSIPEGAFDVRMDGSFSVSGGAGNDIEAYVFDDNSFSAWQDRHVAVPIYSSGGRTSHDTIKITLPAGPGTYWLVFNNRFSLLSPKAVEANVTVYYNK